MGTVKISDHTEMFYEDNEYVKVEKVDDYMVFGMVDDDDDDVDYVKVEFTASDSENAYPIDDLENKYPADDLENEYPVDDLENEYPADDLENEYPADDLENEDADDDLENENSDDDLENENSDDDMEIKDPFNDVLCKKRFFDHFAPLTKAVEIKDLVKDIVLPYLPAKSIVRFRSVSKEWDKWIKSPFLAHLQSYHFKHLSGFFCQPSGTNHTFITLDQTAYGLPTSYLGFSSEDVKLLSSSNGLLLCQGPSEFDPYYVCNPATKDWTILPSPTVFNGYESAVVLAFDPSVLNMEANYRVLRVISLEGFVYFDIYSSQTNSWEVSGTVLVGMEETKINDNGFFYLNGIVYLTSIRSVIAFDLSSEVYEVISLPFECSTYGVLTQIEGELCYINVLRCAYSSNKYSIMIYAGMELSLRRRLCVSIGLETSNRYPSYRVLPCLDGHNVLVVVEGGMIYSCNTSDGSVKVATRVVGPAVTSASTKYLPYVNSLVHVA